MNVNVSKDFLIKAIKYLPLECSEVKSYLNIAFQKMQEMERPIKKDIIPEKPKKTPLYNPGSLEILDKMIEEEKQKLNQKKPNDDDMGTLLG